MVDDFWNLPFPGVYVRVLQPGNVAKGDRFTLLESNPDSLSVSQVFSIFRSNRTDINLIKKAIDEPFLADSCRKDIQKLLK
jgi:MOSC domain-containing protein YiiM